MSADSDMVERVARHIAKRMHEPNPNAWRMNLRVETYALEASHHAEAVYLLNRAADALLDARVGLALRKRINAHLAKIGGDQ